MSLSACARTPLAPCPMPRPRCLEAQRVAPRGAGLPRRVRWPAAHWCVLAACAWAYLAAHVAVACWRALP